MAKRGRLKRTVIKHLYGKDGSVAGHTVTAEHEPDEDDMNRGAMDSPSATAEPLSIETPHETHESAIWKAVEHHRNNMKRFGGKKSKHQMDPEAMQAAVGRRR